MDNPTLPATEQDLAAEEVKLTWVPGSDANSPGCRHFGSGDAPHCVTPNVEVELRLSRHMLIDRHVYNNYSTTKHPPIILS